MQKQKYFINDIIALCPMTTDSSIRNWVRKDMTEQQGNEEYVLASPTKEHTREKWTFTLAGVEYMLKKHTNALDQSVFDAINELKKGKNFDEVVQQINAKNETLTVEEARQLIKEELDKLEQNNQSVVDPVQLQTTIDQAVKREIQTLNQSNNANAQLIKDVNDLKRQVNKLSQAYQQGIEHSDNDTRNNQQNNHVVDAVVVDGNEWQELKQEIADMRNDVKQQPMKLVSHDEVNEQPVVDHAEEGNDTAADDAQDAQLQRRSGNEPAFDEDDTVDKSGIDWHKMWLPVVLIIAGLLLMLKVIL